FPTNQKSGRSHVTLSFTEAPLMRLSVGRLRQVVKRDLPIEFVPQQLTSYGGLELLHRYVRRLGLYPRLRRAGADLGGDYGGLGRMPTARTVTNWLRRFTHATLRPLIQLNQELVLESLARLDVPRLTLDVDGTVVRTGATVAWAFRGFNPHHRKDLSYYPLVAHVAQTGHILRLKNRPGNVHDSKQSAAFLRELIEAVRARLGRSLPLEFRMDAAFFQRDVLRLLAARRCTYAIKIGYWSWLPLKQLAAERRQWHALAPDVTGVQHQLGLPLRSQQRLAAAQRARVQPRPQLPARYRRCSPPSLPQAHLHVRPAEHAHPALHARRPRRSAGAHRRAPRASPHLQPGHRGPLHETGATPCRLIYFRIGVSSASIQGRIALGRRA